MQERNSTGQNHAAEARRYALVIEWSDEDQVYIVSAPDLPGLRTHGATREEAVAMGEEAVVLWLGANQRMSRPTPPARFTALPYSVRSEAKVREVAGVGHADGFPTCAHNRVLLLLAVSPAHFDNMVTVYVQYNCSLIVP